MDRFPSSAKRLSNIAPWQLQLQRAAPTESASDLAGSPSLSLRFAVCSLEQKASSPPVHKKGPRDFTRNYRPVSQSALARLICEKIVAGHFSQYLQKNCILDARQQGFVPKNSCCSQLLVMTQDYARFINEKTPFHAVYLVQRSAFEEVDHRLLLHKMTDIGVHSEVIVSGCS